MEQKHAHSVMLMQLAHSHSQDRQNRSENESFATALREFYEQYQKYIEADTFHPHSSSDLLSTAESIESHQNPSFEKQQQSVGSSSLLFSSAFPPMSPPRAFSLPVIHDRGMRTGEKTVPVSIPVSPSRSPVSFSESPQQGSFSSSPSTVISSPMLSGGEGPDRSYSPLQERISTLDSAQPSTNNSSAGSASSSMPSMKYAQFLEQTIDSSSPIRDENELSTIDFSLSDDLDYEEGPKRVYFDSLENPK